MHEIQETICRDLINKIRDLAKQTRYALFDIEDKADHLEKILQISIKMPFGKYEGTNLKEFLDKYENIKIKEHISKLINKETDEYNHDVRKD